MISSLKRTIAFYDASDPRELQQIIMNMKKMIQQNLWYSQHMLLEKVWITYLD